MTKIQRNELTQERVKELFTYSDGFLYHKSHRIKAMGYTKVDYLHKYNHGDRYTTSINKKCFLCSRLIFLYHHGYMPQLVDHIDRNTQNDRIENLRPATRNQNNSNVTCHKNGTSKYLGVYSRFRYNHITWVAGIKSNGKQNHLGHFKTENDAAKAYNAAAIIYHGEFANLNIII